MNGIKEVIRERRLKAEGGGQRIGPMVVAGERREADPVTIGLMVRPNANQWVS
jgi:hypothetical protein